MEYPFATFQLKKDILSMRCLRIHPCLIAAFCMVSTLSCVAQEPAVSSEVSYLSFAVPGALGTYPTSLNKSMTVTGYYYASSTVARGFVRGADGAITTFEVGGGFWTEPESINAAGEIAGYYEVDPGVPLGFVRYPDGRVVTFDAALWDCPCDPRQSDGGQPISINSFGETAGNYPWPWSGASNGFRRTASGVITIFGFALGADYPTVVTGLNDSGSIVGYFSSGSYTTDALSFVLDPDGSFAEFSVPSDAENKATIAQSINAEGTIAGWYTICTDHTCLTRITGGFVRSPQGVFTLFTPPGELLTLPGSGPMGWYDSLLSAPGRLSINQQGSITGSYTDTAGTQHGFVRNPYGTITSFDPPRGGNTTAVEINDDGVIVGSYSYDWSPQIAQGFLRIPVLLH